MNMTTCEICGKDAGTNAVTYGGILYKRSITVCGVDTDCFDAAADLLEKEEGRKTMEDAKALFRRLRENAD